MEEKSIEQEFTSLMDKLGRYLNSNGVNKSVYAKDRIFPTLPTEEKVKIIDVLKHQVNNMEIITPEQTEGEKLQTLLSYNDITPVDESVYKRLTNDMCWEIIDFSVNQIYRNDLCFKVTSYSAEELEIRNVWDLFLRPQSVMKDLAHYMEQIQTSNSLISMANFTPYIMEEIFSTEKLKLEIDHQFACGLKRKGSNRISLFLSAFKWKTLNDSDNKVSIFSPGLPEH